MDFENQDQDIYGLIGKLCENLINVHTSVEENPYLPQKDNQTHLRKLKSKAYEILLKKSSISYENEEPSDPIVELLKYTFDLRVTQGRISHAAELQQYLDEFIEEKLDPNSVTYSVLQFLNCLKSSDPPEIEDDSLDVFYFGKPHPQLPEMFYKKNDTAPFQIYPSNSFYLPPKFENKFKEKSSSIIKFNIGNPKNTPSLLNQFSNGSNFEKQITRYNNNVTLSLSSIPQSTSSILNGADLNFNSYFIPQIKDIERLEDQFQICQEGIVTEPETPWQCKDPLQLFADNNLYTNENFTEICEIKENFVDEDIPNLDKIWEKMDKISPVSSHRTWETLGKMEPPKEQPFASESIEATVHIVNIAQNNILSDQPQSAYNKIISNEEFIKSLKLLILGVESDSFIYNRYTGFELKKNINIYGISRGTLENICEEITQCGTYYRKLSELVVPDPTTEKLKIDGLIFKALCSSLKEFLLFYHAAALKVTMRANISDGLLAFLQKIRPLGKLIFKVAELCRCENHRETSLGEGICILTHIYKEVTKVTEENVALVFYSILKECCEVYFRFLQQWIFEGLCVDYYEEFMIKVRPQYTRTRGHRFWTRAFSINKESVPGFLSEVTDAILRCGKAVTLLRICDPQNPLCQMSAINQPSVRVCLSVGMLREQEKFYEKYYAEGIAVQGEEVSFYTAIKEQKEIEKRKAELVMAAQRKTLERLKKEKKEEYLRVSKEKSELLEQLKIQVEEVARRKEKDRNAELLADKLYLENVAENEKKAKLIEQAEREKTLKYYNELAEEVERRRIQAEQLKTPDERDADEVVQENKQKSENLESEEQNELLKSIKGDSSFKTAEDELNNPEAKENEKQDNSNDNNNENIYEPEENSNNTLSVKSAEPTISKKAVRPTVLDIIGINTQKNTNDVDIHDDLKNIPKQSTNLSDLKETDNMTAAQRNKLKVLQQEYGLTPNNNESQTIISSPNKKLPLTDAQINREKIMSVTDLNSNDPQIAAFSEKLSLTPAQINREKIMSATDFNLNDQEITEVSEKTLLTPAQINREKIMSATDFNLNDQEITEVSEKTLLTSAQINREKIMSATDFNLNDQEITELSEKTPLTAAQINRDKIMSVTDIYINEPEITGIPKKSTLTDAQINREKIMSVTDFNLDDPEVIGVREKSKLTDAQINRNKIMSHFYMDEPESTPSIKSGKLSDLQINRNRNMTHVTGQFDYEGFKSVDNEQFKETPMSTATDYFTVSTNSNSLLMRSCENTPLTENNNSQSEMMCAKSSDGISIDTSPSRNFKHFQDTPSYPNFIGFPSGLSTPSPENHQLTAADVKMIDSTSLEVYLERSVVIPLLVQSRLVNRAVIKYLLTEHKMLSHLQSLRSYFFLLNGEFARSLTQSLFTKLYKVSTPIELFNSSTLSHFLDNALVSSLSGSYANSELLSLSATKIPSYVQTSNPEILSCLSLNYKISWPLNIIFNDMVMQQYSKVFKFLLMVGHVLWVLKEDFHILKTVRKHVFVQNHHKLQLYRHAMMQFMNALHTYLTCSVLHASWSEFEKELENVTTLDEVNSTHVSYIKKILSRCMLNAHNETMRTCLCNIFKVVLKFHNRIRAQNWNGESKTGPNYANLENMYIAFCEQRAYLAHLANKLANRGYQPHLMQFLHALNINPRYDLTYKK